VRKETVPQDGEVTTYGGGRKLLYAVDRDGRYVGVQSVGWSVETEATRSAIDDLQQQQQDAWYRAKSGMASPLEYYMYLRRMDIALLAQTTGLWQWRIRRHFHPAVFARLDHRMLTRYAEALGIEISQLRTLPDQPCP
jgi:hypothetical protein